MTPDQWWQGVLAGWSDWYTLVLIIVCGFALLGKANDR